jgi:hypothetical protein
MLATPETETPMKSKQILGRDIIYRLPFTMVQEIDFCEDMKDFEVEGFVWRMDRVIDVQRSVIKYSTHDRTRPTAARIVSRTV